ncbi:hypothetical protein EDD86DRAFT_203604 [Gorgonomyces haynaldii]|nr:hypothetical protein EDD86DRAFT_203604 [Gorgonomyces haynaldii]
MATKINTQVGYAPCYPTPIEPELELCYFFLYLDNPKLKQRHSLCSLQDEAIPFHPILHLQVNMDLGLHFDGEFKQILLLKQPQAQAVTLRTSVYSFDNKILQVKETLCSESLQFQFIPDFFETFFASYTQGLLDIQDLAMALKNLRITQEFTAKNRTLLVLKYQFQIGDGTVVVDF